MPALGCERWRESCSPLTDYAICGSASLTYRRDCRYRLGVWRSRSEQAVTRVSASSSQGRTLSASWTKSLSRLRMSADWIISGVLTKRTSASTPQSRSATFRLEAKVKWRLRYGA